MSSTEIKPSGRLIELRRHQVYRLQRPSQAGLLKRLRRGMRVLAR